MTIVSESLPMTVRADWVPGPPQGCWTYDDYAAIPEDGNRYEVIEGVLYLMAGANTKHQGTSLQFSIYLGIHVQHGGLGRVFHAPYDVRLPGHAQPVQPDLVVVLNANLAIIKDKYIDGVPDLLIEIASPGTAGYDRRTKQDAYAAAGVPEYWLADPDAEAVEVLVLEGGAYRSLGVFAGSRVLPSVVLPGFAVQVQQFFA